MMYAVEKLVDGKQEFEVVNAESVPQAINQCDLLQFDENGKPIAYENEIGYVGVYELGQTNLLDFIADKNSLNQFYLKETEKLKNELAEKYDSKILFFQVSDPEYMLISAKNEKNAILIYADNADMSSEENVVMEQISYQNALVEIQASIAEDTKKPIKYMDALNQFLEVAQFGIEKVLVLSNTLIS